MRPTVSVEEMRRCDTAAIRSYGIPSLLLMENAGRGAAVRIADLYGPLKNRNVAVVCGKGNNGGDGFVVARHLLNTGADITVLLASPTRGDAGRNLKILRALQRRSDHLTIVQWSRNAAKALRPYLIVDALFGTGVSGSLTSRYVSIVDWINGQRAAVVALDIPSGINGTNGLMANAAVRAEQTMTMGALKVGLLCNDGKECSGAVEVVDIGIPESVFSGGDIRTWLLEESDALGSLPKRNLRVHKYSVGKVFVLAGATGYTGAAALTAMAALRSGAGAVVMGTPESVYPILAKKMSEVIVLPLPATKEGSLGLPGLEAIEKRIQWADVTVIGPGLSQHPETAELVRNLTVSMKGKLLLDADGLNAVAADVRGLMRRTKASVTLTPHTGEFSRLTGHPAADVERLRLHEVRIFSREIRQTVVLKGAPTVTGIPDGSVFVNSTGNPGMATVGSGDVLSGIVAGLWAQGMDQGPAAYTGVWVHGRAGDLAKGRMGERSVVAGDLIDFLPRAMERQGSA